MDTNCSMAGCDSFCTLGHMLSACSKSLDRFKFRHDSVLNHLFTTINKNKKEEVTTFADLNGWRVNGGTIPPDLVPTEQIPDLVIIDRTEVPTKVVLLELTVPWDSASSFKAALDRKTARYERLALDLVERGCVVSNMPLEIGCRGVIDKRNSLVLETICNMFGIRAHQRLKGALGRISLLGSFRIYIFGKEKLRMEWRRAHNSELKSERGLQIVSFFFNFFQLLQLVSLYV